MTEAPKPEPRLQMTAEELAARKKRNLWLALSLAGFVVLVMAVTMIRLTTGEGVSTRM